MKVLLAVVSASVRLGMVDSPVTRNALVEWPHHVGVMGCVHSKCPPQFVPVTRMPQTGTGQAPTVVCATISTRGLLVFSHAQEPLWPAMAEVDASRHKPDHHAPATTDSAAMPVSSLLAHTAILVTLVPLVLAYAPQLPFLVRLPSPARDTAPVARARLVTVPVCAMLDTLVPTAPPDAPPPALPYHALEMDIVA